MADIFKGQRAGFAILLVSTVCLLTAAQAGAEDEHVQGELIVKLKGSATSMSSSAFLGKARAMSRMHLKRSWSGINTHHFVMSSEAEAQAQLAVLKNDPAVEYAEPNYIIGLSATDTAGPAVRATSDDTASSTDNGNCTINRDQTTSGIDRQAAWTNISNNGNKPIVAVVDTGLALTHPTFTATNAIWTNAGETGTDTQGRNKSTNGVDDDGNGYIDDVHGWNFVSNTNSPQDDNEHGTHVSGIILGTTEDIITPARTGSAPSAAVIQIMPLKFLDSTGSGTTADGITAIYYAVANGAKVINASWGGSSFSNGLIEAIAYAYSHGVTVVTAAGNNGSSNDSSPTYPANYNVPSQITVAASYDSDDSLAYFSNFGSSTVQVAGPGYYILSTLPNATTAQSSSNFGCLSGTSMATPFVSGIAALIYHEQPSMSGYQVRNLVMSTVDLRTSVLSQKVSTAGRVNANTAIVTAKSATLDSSQPDYNASSYERSTASDASAGGGCGRVQAFDETSGAGKSLEFFALLAVIALPLLVNRYVRARHAADDDSKNRRRHERFNIASEVRMNVGGRELKGSLSTISLGGVQLNADALLEQGGIVTMLISSPDGKEQIKVEGQIVWSAESKHYGVQFAQAEDGALASIGQWTKNLTKSS